MTDRGHGSTPDTEVLICLGSGGSGKTTVAAALGLRAAAAGRRAVVVTIDPARRLAEVLGLDDSGEPGALHRVALDQNGSDTPGEMWATMLDTRSTFEQIVREEADPDRAERIVDNTLFQNLVENLSGTHEYMAVERLRSLSADDRFDLVVVDTPPARQAVDFLDSPTRLVRFLDHPLYRALLMPRRGVMRAASVAAQRTATTIGRIVGTGLVEEIIELFRVFEGLERGFRDRADEVGRLLTSDRARYVLVTAPDRESLGQCRWLADRLAGRDLTVAHLVVNRLLPFADVDPGRGSTDDVLEANLRSMTALARQERRAVDEAVSCFATKVALDREARSMLERRVGAIADLDALAGIAADLTVELSRPASRGGASGS